ncbi:hypothetical protein AgCh_004694 [Apium graveolens]
MEVMKIFSTTELKRGIILMKDKDTSARMWKAAMFERLRKRNEIHARIKAEREERERQYAKEIEMFEQRSNGLKERGPKSTIVFDISPGNIFKRAAQKLEDEAIEVIKSFRYLCSLESQESLDNILLELYKRCGRMEEHIEVLQEKIKHIEKGLLLGGRRVKTARCHGKKSQIIIEHEYSRKVLSLEQDKNKQFNPTICLMYTNRIIEAKFLLESARSSENGLMEATHIKSFERASHGIDSLPLYVWTLDSSTRCKMM